MGIEAPAMEHPKVARQKIATATSLSGSSRDLTETTGMQSRQKAQDANYGRPGSRKMATVSWYGRLLIVTMLLVAAGWELLRLIVAIITLD
jgi:hypothetical protein